FKLSFDLRAFTQDDRLFRDDVTFHVAINPESPLDRQRSLEGHALINESGPLFAGAIFCRSVPLPCHIEFPQSFKHFYFSGTRAEVNATKEGCCRMIRLNQRTVSGDETAEAISSIGRRGASTARRRNTQAQAAPAVSSSSGAKSF